MSSGGRRLRDDEHELWKGVTRSIKPLRPHVAADRGPTATTAPARKSPSREKLTANTTQAAAKTAAIPPLAPLGRRMRQKLARGTEEIDAKLDLHGRTQAQAHSALLNFLRNAQAQGVRNVLVITGKGKREFAGERGVLKRQVPMWLRLPEFRVFVVGFEEAHIGHGGEGALYVRVRRA